MSITSVIRYVQALDTTATDGSGKTGLAFGDITAKYLVQGGTLTSLTTETITTLGTYQAPTSASDIRIKELAASDPTKGIYEVHFHDLQVAASGKKLWLFLSATGARFQPFEMDLIPYLDQDATSASDFKDLVDTGYDPSGHNINSDAKKINNVSTSSVTTINAHQGTTQPVNFHGTGTTAYVKTDLYEVLDTAANPGTVDANVVSASTAGKADIAAAVWEKLGAAYTDPSMMGYIFQYTLNTSVQVNSLYLSQIAILGLVSDVAPTASAFDSSLTDPDDFWEDQPFAFTTGALKGQCKPVSTYKLVGGKGRFTFNEPFTSAPGNGDGFSIGIGHIHPTTQIASAIFQNTDAANFTVSGSWGKSVAPPTLGTSPGAANGFPLVGSQMDLINGVNPAAVAAIHSGLATDTSIVDLSARVPAALSPGGMMMADVEELLGTTAQPTVITPHKNTALSNFEFPMFAASDGKTLLSGLTITATRSLDGGAFAACANAATEVGTTGVYKINLSAADMNGDTITLMFDGGATANVAIFTIVTQP